MGQALGVLGIAALLTSAEGMLIRAFAAVSRRALLVFRDRQPGGWYWLRLDWPDLLFCALAGVGAAMMSAAHPQGSYLAPSWAFLVGLVLAAAITEWARVGYWLRISIGLSPGQVIGQARWVETPWPAWSSASMRYRVSLGALLLEALAANLALAAALTSTRPILGWAVVAFFLVMGLPTWAALASARDAEAAQHT